MAGRPFGRQRPAGDGVSMQPATDKSLDRALASLGRFVKADALRSIRRVWSELPDPQVALDRLLELFRRAPRGALPANFGGRTVHAALTVFSNSRYLSDMLLGRPNLLSWVLEPSRLERPAVAGELRSEIGCFSLEATDEDVAAELARIKREQMLRIAVRDLLGFAQLAETTAELSNLADVIIQAGHDHVRDRLVRRFGRPLVQSESANILCDFVVLALGKLGGTELNYSSDVDLMYIHTGDGKTQGPVVTTNRDFVDRLAKRLTNLLSMTTPEGFNYRIDLRLRPEGSAGELVIPVSSAAHYYFHRARDWELQMLLKARPVAGDHGLGRRLLEVVTPRIYRTTTDFTQIEKLAQTRDRIQKARRPRSPLAMDVKLDPGGIRDIEFLVQCLQRLYGGQDRFLRSGGTMYALHRLREKGYLEDGDYSRLFQSYSFLRKIEHRLQMANNSQTHQLPVSDEAATRVAVQIGIRRGKQAPDEFRARVTECCRSVSEIYDRVIRGQQESPEVQYSTRRLAVPASDRSDSNTPSPVASSVWRVHLPRISQRSESLAERFEAVQLRWGNRSLEHFLDRLLKVPEALDLLSENPGLVPRVAHLMEYSNHFGGYLVRFPKDLKALLDDARLSSEPPGRVVERILAGNEDPDESAAELRKLYRKRMLCIQTRSICDGEDVFDTLAQSSDLADAILRGAHALALHEAAPSDAVEDSPGSLLRVIALGRLGMREFDFGSDADVVFVIPDSQAHNLQTWTHVANRFIDIVSSYTVDGQMFPIDARLRPLGRDGNLVQTEGQFLAYFADRAESWEVITYMKARHVAGDGARGREFLADLQGAIWRRFSHLDGFASLLLKMRGRLEAEQGTVKPLRSGPGGYYDIDFLLLYWRLRHAGSFYESLNTPERVEIIRQTDPAFDDRLDTLLDGARVLRAIDHGTRVFAGSSAHALPPTAWHRELLGELVARWLPGSVAGRPLEEVVAATRRDVRRVFGQGFAGVA